jgi:RNA polymerase sigma-70 factor (ECF subfamily)
MLKGKTYKLLEKYLVENKEAHYRLAYSYVKNKEDALDMIQESIYKAFRYIDSLEDLNFIKNWFYKILINTSLDFLRKNNRVSFVEDNILEANSEANEDRYEDLDLKDALDSLPDNVKTIIILRYFEDLKLEDIAYILGISLGTVKTRLYTGLKKLRIEMEN